MEPKLLASEASDFFDISLPGLHKQIKNNNLVSEKKNNKVCINHDTARKLNPFKVSPLVTAVQIVKGGTGKTGVCFALAVRASLYGFKVLIVDGDQQWNITQACGIDPDKLPSLIDFVNSDNYSFEDCIVPVIDGLDILPGKLQNAMVDNVITIKHMPLDRVFSDPISELKNKYDFIFIDCPPALGASVGAFTCASDLVIAPVDPDRFSIGGLDVSLEQAKTLGRTFRKKIDIKVLVNKFDTRTSMSHTTLEELYSNPKYSKILFKSFVRTSTEFPKAIQAEGSIFDTLRKTPAKEDIDLVLKELINYAGSKIEKSEKASDSKVIETA